MSAVPGTTSQGCHFELAVCCSAKVGHGAAAGWLLACNLDETSTDVYILRLPGLFDITVSVYCIAFCLPLHPYCASFCARRN